jgi:hypothetical protein
MRGLNEEQPKKTELPFGIMDAISVNPRHPGMMWKHHRN